MFYVSDVLDTSTVQYEFNKVEMSFSRWWIPGHFIRFLSFYYDIFRTHRFILLFLFLLILFDLDLERERKLFFLAVVAIITPTGTSRSSTAKRR